MKLRVKAWLPAALIAILASAPVGVRANNPVWPPPTADWAGTTDINWTATRDGTPVFPKRVGIVAYCADLYHNAGDTGLQAGKRNVRDSFAKQSVQAFFGGTVGGNWFLDGPFDTFGHYGAQNLVDYFAYDDSITRLRDVEVIDGSLFLPTATQLIRNFDIVIAYTDNKCGQPIPNAIANSAADALSGFIAVPGKKLLLTGFAFSSSIGFGNAVFAAGLSPLRKGGPGLDQRCNRDTPCPVGTCPAGCTLSGDPPECRDDVTGANCTAYTPTSANGTLGTNNADLACDQMLANVRGPTTSSWATALTEANVATGASLCLNYDISPPVPFLAINAARNIMAVNAFPPDSADIQKFWFGCIFGNMLQYFSGDIDRCTTSFCR